MIHDSNSQHWLFFGTSPASEKVWGLRKIDFPCGYFMPSCAFSNTDNVVVNPSPGKEVWAIGGFAFEIAEECRNIDIEKAASSIKGYYPWIALFYSSLIDELKERNHTIQIWDKGVSIFYDMWRESCQYLGDFIGVDKMKEIYNKALMLDTGGGEIEGYSFDEYYHSPEKIIKFMAEFMTLSNGDIFILGPLVANLIKPEEELIKMSVAEFEYTVKIDQKLKNE